MRSIFLLVIAIALFSCNTSTESKVTQTKEQGASTQNEVHSIRYDGIYQSETNKDARSFLRFYEDGTVLSVTSTGEAKDLKSWFAKENFNKPQNAKGKYELKENDIYFTTSSDYGTVSYKGSLTDEYNIELKVKSLINGNEVEKTFFFIKF